MPANTSLPVIDYIEIEITEFCNLNCKGCCDFSNLAKEKNFYDIDEFTKDMKRITEIFSSVNKIRLMGGEPLLNPELTEYIKVTRELFPLSDIRIVSNGLLIPKLDTGTLAVIKEADCKFDISNYPPTRKMFTQIKAKLESAGIEYDLGFPMNFFFRNILEHPSDDPAPAFNNCIFTHCHMLSHGKLSPCSYAHCTGRLNAEYGFDYPETDTIDIYSDITGEEIIKRFNAPHEFCKCCGKGIIPFRWQGGTTSSKASPYDWLIKDSFMNTTVAPVIQSVLKVPAKLLRSRIQKK